MLLPISILSEKNKERTVETKALLDTGAGGKFIDQNFVLAHGIRTHKLEKPITVYNVDGTKNKTGTITRYADVKLQVRDRTRTTRLMVTGLGKQKVILGFPWFKEMNLEINWKEGTLTWQKENRTPATITEVLDEESLDLLVININGKFAPVWINAKSNLAMDMAIKNNLKKKELSVTEVIPFPRFWEDIERLLGEHGCEFSEIFQDWSCDFHICLECLHQSLRNSG